MRQLLGTRSFSASAAADPIDFKGIPEKVGGKWTRVSAIGIDLQLSLTSGAGGTLAAVTNVGYLALINEFKLTSGKGQGTRQIARIAGGWRMRQWYYAMFGRLAAIDGATIAASTSNAARRVSLILACRQNAKVWRRPKDFDLPTAALRDGGQIDIRWGAIADATNLSAMGTGTSAANVWCEFHADDDAESALPWEMNYIETSDNTPALPDDVAYAFMMNGDQDHSDQTTVNIPDRGVRNVSFAVLAGEFNRKFSEDITAGAGALTITAPEILPLITPDIGHKTVDVPIDSGKVELTRSSSDTQHFAFLRLLDVEKHTDDMAKAYGVDAAKARAAGLFARKWVAKNAPNVAGSPAEAIFRRRIPWKLDRAAFGSCRCA